MMNVNHLREHLRCPTCGDALEMNEEILTCQKKHSWEIKNDLPRFVPAENYAGNFGYQWNKHRETQLDSYSKTSISADRLWNETGWLKEDFSDKMLLECGSGAGRFTEVLKTTSANVFTIDFSDAVEANYKSNGESENVFIAQASIYELPFPLNHFDYLLCLGVIQHTPDIKLTINSMLDHLKPGGKFCFDVYAAPLSYLHPRQFLRPITKRISNETLYKTISWVVPKLLPVSNALHKVPLLGEGLARLVPIANWRYLELPKESDYIEWSILDTFDWYSPEYESPQTKATLTKLLKNYGVRDFEIFRVRGLYVIRGTK